MLKLALCCFSLPLICSGFKDIKLHQQTLHTKDDAKQKVTSQKALVFSFTRKQSSGVFTQEGVFHKLHFFSDLKI